jgi:hypothetical protein
MQDNKGGRLQVDPFDCRSTAWHGLVKMQGNQSKGKPESIAVHGSSFQGDLEQTSSSLHIGEQEVCPR